jgi:hypothetical protein
MAENTLTLEDRLMLQELFAKFTFSMDSGDKEGFLDCFTKDGTMFTRTGHEAIGGYLDEFKHDSAFPGSQHLATNFYMEGNSERARVRCYITRMYKLPGAGNLQPLWLGWDDDICVKVDGQWKFEKMSTTPSEILRGAPRPAERVPSMVDLGGPRGSR